MQNAEKDQKELVGLMAADIDEPSRWDLLATAAIVGLILFGTFQGWW